MDDPDAPLTFPGKKLVASWFTPTDPQLRAVLPRVFVSEIQVRVYGTRAVRCAARRGIVRCGTVWYVTDADSRRCLIGPSGG